MNEEKPMNELPSTPEENPVIPEENPAIPEESSAIPEQPAALQPDAPGEPEQKNGQKKAVSGERVQIYSIKKKKKEDRKAEAADEEKKRRGRHKIVQKHDIRYRGPLSYRHMMILGWLCVVLSQVSLILSTGGKLDPTVTKGLEGLIAVGKYAGSFFMPFLLLANFSRILSAKQQFKSLLLKFGGLSVAMGLALPVVYEHYITGVADAAHRLNPELGEQFLAFIQNQVFQNGYLAYNLFIDLFLCTLFMFFLTYHFKRPVSRGWVIGFRLLSILPVAYELTSIILKTLCKNGNITLPLYVSPFLTTKPPMMFAAFVALALFIKRRERIFLRSGRSYEEYGHFLETNTNSLHFSVHACITFIVAAIIDMVILLAMTIALTTGDVMATGEMTDQVLENEEMLTNMLQRTLSVAVAAGFGESLTLFLVAPLVLLYSYTRKHKNVSLDTLIPMIAIAAISLLYIEAIFQAACQIPDMVNMYLQANFGISLSEIDFTELDQMLAMPMY